MGSNNGASDEKPVRRVSIKPFYMQEHEVTDEQWGECVAAGKCSNKGVSLSSSLVAAVSWNDITREYIPWLNGVTGKSFRLPTEAEWEYAARAGSSTRYSWGDSDTEICRYANLADGYFKVLNKHTKKQVANCDDRATDTAFYPKSYKGNAFGLYDMHGNLREWVQDCWNGSYSGARRMVVPGRAEIVQSVFCAAAPGPLVRPRCVRRVVTGLPPRIAAALTASVWSRTAEGFACWV